MAGQIVRPSSNRMSSSALGTAQHAGADSAVEDIWVAAETPEQIGLLKPTEALPAALRAEAMDPCKRPSSGLVSCAVYCNEGMIGNGLLALASFKRVAPQMQAVMFTARPQDYLWVKGVDVVDIDEPFRAAHLDVDAWAKQYPGILGHYYRKVAMWLYMLEQSAGTADWHVFIDADVLFLRCIQPVLRYARTHRFAAMIEHWHPSVWTVFQRESPALRRQIDLLFHGQAGPERMRRRAYFNSGFLLARADDADIHAAVKDVLTASVLYPELSRRIPFSEQTLFNIATMARGVVCRDLYGMCVPSYHDESRGWPAPVARHYLADRPHRHPPALYAKYPKLVEDSLAAIGTNVEEMMDRGLFSATAETPSAAQMIESMLVEEDLLVEESLLVGSGSGTTKAARRRRAAIPTSFAKGQ
jgi:hypothetical protein